MAPPDAACGRSKKGIVDRESAREASISWIYAFYVPDKATSSITLKDEI
jgi:hypothetical protein